MNSSAIERSATLPPPVGASLASLTSLTVPVAPVNPSVQVQMASMVTHISHAGEVQAAKVAQAMANGVADPLQRAADPITTERDWTLRKPEPEKVKDPPPEPISKLLLAFLQSMWRASGSAVEVALVQNQSLNQNPNATPGQLAKEELTYTPSKIRKSQSI